MSTPYTIADVGCYVDGSRGIYAVDRIVEIAIEHGMAEPEPCSDHEHAATGDASDYAGCEFAGEIEDECDEHMNAHHAVDGALWGSEQGDWGLWPVEEE